MGCGASREPVDNTIDFHMEFIASQEINEFFKSCEAVLEIAENLRSGLEDSLEEMYEISAVSYLKEPPNLMDAVKVWLWALSANNGGNILKCKPSISISAPYIEIDIPNSEFPPVQELVTFKENLQTYFQTCVEGVTKIPEVIAELVSLIQKANSIKENATNALVQLAGIALFKNIANIGKNIMKLSKGLLRLRNVKNQISEASTNMKGVIKQFPEEIKTVNEKGKAAISKNLTFARQIMQYLHPGDKYSEEEIEEIKAEEERKKKKQEEAKKLKAALLEKALEIKKGLEESLK